LKIEGMREKIGHALALHNDDFDTMIKMAVQKSFTVETIQHKIDMQVAKALDDAIESISNHHAVKTIMKDIVVKSLEKVRDKTEKEKS
jgi:hypothetical protein